jgi:hypothetical protein
MLRYINSWLWALPVLAQVQNFHPRDYNDLTYSIYVPEDTAKSGSGPIFFQMNSTRQVQWFALGQGKQMRGANIFVVYTHNENVTVSPRSGVSEVEPLFNEDAQITILNGSGVHDGVVTANVRCDTCIKWSGGSENINSTSSSWIWAVKFGQSLNSASLSEDITHHDDSGVVFVDMIKATGGSSENPFAQPATASVSSGVEDPSFAAFEDTIHRKQTAHAVLMLLAFVIMFPFFALGLHVFPSKWTVNIHGTFQLLTLTVAISGLGVGVSMARQLHLIDSYHAIIGMIVVSSLVLFQPAMGLLQHLFFRKTGGKGPFAYMHRWFGRTMMVLGVINAGLGFKLALGPRGAIIATSVVAGIIAVVYIAVVSWAAGLRRRSQ